VAKDVETNEGPCPYCEASAFLVHRVLKGDGGKVIGQPRLIRVECSNPRCPGEDVNEVAARIVHEATEASS
jgi:hypothetical protein